MNGESQVVANAEHSAKGVGAHAQVANLTQEFESVAFLLQWILLGVGSAVNLDFLGLNLKALSLAL